MILEGKTVVVTGVGPGLGGEVAKLVLRDGGNVGPRRPYRRQARLPSRRRSTRAATGWPSCRPTSVTSSSAAPWPELAVERFGAVDGVVQVAAYDGLLAGLDGTSDDEWQAVLGTNVVGSMHVVPRWPRRWVTAAAPSCSSARRARCCRR